MVSTHYSSVVQADDAAILQVVNSGPVDNTVVSEQPQTDWATETELIFFPGTRRVMLTVQRPLMRTVIQDAFEQVQKALMFHNAFPDTYVALDFTRDALLIAAECHKQAMNIYNRLVVDADYMNIMTRLVSLHIPITKAINFFFSFFFF